MALTISILIDLRYVLIFFLTWKLSFNHFLNNADVKMFTGQSRTFSFDFRGPWDSVQNICFGKIAFDNFRLYPLYGHFFLWVFFLRFRNSYG